MAQFCESNLSVPLTLWAYNIYVPVSSLFTIRDDRDGVQSKNTASLKIINLIKLIINHKIFQKKQKCFTCSMFDTTYADKRYYSLPVFWGQQHLLRKHRSLTSVHNIWQNTVYYVLAWYSCCSEKIALQRRKTVPFNYTVSTFLKTSQKYQAKTKCYVLTWFSGWDFLKLLCFGFGRQSGLLGQRKLKAAI